MSGNEPNELRVFRYRFGGEIVASGCVVLSMTVTGEETLLGDIP